MELTSKPDQKSNAIVDISDLKITQFVALFDFLIKVNLVHLKDEIWILEPILRLPNAGYQSEVRPEL